MKRLFFRWLLRQPEVQKEIREAVAAAQAEQEARFGQMFTQALTRPAETRRRRS